MHMLTLTVVPVLPSERGNTLFSAVPSQTQAEDLKGKAKATDVNQDIGRTKIPVSIQSALF